MAPPARRSVERATLTAALALAGALLAAQPTGVRSLDVLWSAAFVAALADAGAYASPLTLLLAAAGAAVLSNDGAGVVLAAASVLSAGATATQGRPSSRLTALAGGLLGLALLQQGSADAAPVIAGTAAISLVVVVSGWRGMSPRRQVRLRWAIAGVLTVVGLAAVAGGLAGVRARSAADDGVEALRAARTAATGGDLEAAVDDFRDAERAFRRASEPLQAYGRFGHLVPGLAQQLDAAETAVDTAGDAASAMRRAGGSIHLDAIAVQGGSLDPAALAAAEAPLATASDVLVSSVLRLRGIQRTSLVPPLRDSIDDALEEARAAAATVDRARRAVQEAPALLGADRPTRYLVLFTSPVEARNRFGLPGAFAVLAFDDGHLRVERAGPMDEIDPPAGFDQAALSVPSRAAPFAAYGVSRNWRSVTLPSSGPAVADLALQMAAQVGLGPLDGVILADPQALAEVVGILGDVPVPGLDTTLTRDTTVQFLNRDQYLQFPQLGQNRDRKDALALVAAGVGERLEALSLPRVQDLVDRFGPLVAAGHLVVSVPADQRPGAAELLADLGLDGDFPGPRTGAADVLYVGQRNNVGNKIDSYLERTLSYAVEIDRRGALTAELTVDLVNTAPADGLPSYVIGSALADAPPPGTNRTTSLIYSRHQLVDLTVDGVPITPPALADGELLVYQVGVDLAPGQHRRIVAHLQGDAGDGPYAVEALRTALANPDQVAVQVHDARTGGRATWSGSPDQAICTAPDRGRGSGCDAERAP